MSTRRCRRSIPIVLEVLLGFNLFPAGVYPELEAYVSRWEALYGDWMHNVNPPLASLTHTASALGPRVFGVMSEEMGNELIEKGMIIVRERAASFGQKFTTPWAFPTEAGGNRNFAASSKFCDEQVGQTRPLEANGPGGGDAAAENKSSGEKTPAQHIAVKLATEAARTFKMNKAAVDAAAAQEIKLGDASLAGEKKALELFCKAEPFNVELKAACRYCTQVSLWLKELEIGYTETLVDTKNYPAWFRAKLGPHASLPVLRHGETIITGSSSIITYIRKKWRWKAAPFSSPLELSHVEGADLIGAALAVVKAPTSSSERQHSMKMLENLLTSINAAVNTATTGGGNFLGGETINSIDIALIVKLYHAMVILDNWSGTSEMFAADHGVKLPQLHAYLRAWAQRRSWIDERLTKESVVLHCAFSAKEESSK